MCSSPPRSIRWWWDMAHRVQRLEDIGDLPPRQRRLLRDIRKHLRFRHRFGELRDSCQHSLLGDELNRPMITRSAGADTPELRLRLRRRNGRDPRAPAQRVPLTALEHEARGSSRRSRAPGSAWMAIVGVQPIKLTAPAPSGLRWARGLGGVQAACHGAPRDPIQTTPGAPPGPRFTLG